MLESTDNANNLYHVTEQSDDVAEKNFALDQFQRLKKEIEEEPQPDDGYALVYKDYVEQHGWPDKIQWKQFVCTCLPNGRFVFCGNVDVNGKYEQESPYSPDLISQVLPRFFVETGRQ
jgi:hypothetical protein